MYSSCGRRFTTPLFGGTWGLGWADSVARTCIPISSPLTHKVYLLLFVELFLAPKERQKLVQFLMSHSYLKRSYGAQRINVIGRNKQTVTSALLYSDWSIRVKLVATKSVDEIIQESKSQGWPISEWQKNGIKRRKMVEISHRGQKGFTL